MVITHVNENPGDLSNIEAYNLAWLVTEYTSGDHDGFGVAYGKGADGKYWEWELGHGSCYGPFDYSPAETTLDAIIATVRLEPQSALSLALQNAEPAITQMIKES